MQEYYEGSKRSEDLLVLARRTLERLRKVGLLSYHLGKYLIKIFVQVCPAQMEMDGLLNLWIIKPGCSSRGRGITISNRLERILGIVEHGAGAKQARYTVVAMVRTPQNQISLYYSVFGYT